MHQADIRWPGIPQRNFSTIGPLTNIFGIFRDAFASSITMGGDTAKTAKVDTFSFSTSELIYLADGFFEIYMRLPFSHEVVEGSAYRPNLLLKRSRPLPGRGDLPRIAEAWPVSKGCEFPYIWRKAYEQE